jgi:hypothetical protein
LTKGKIRGRITTPNPPKPLEKTEFFTYSCYVHGKTGGSKSFDIQTIYAIPGGFPGVMTMAHPIILLSREKIFKKKSIDRTCAFFG